MSNKIWRNYNARDLLDIHIWPLNWYFSTIQENRNRTKLGAQLKKPSYFHGLVYGTTLEWKIMPP
jgi:hypothetical protein